MIKITHENQCVSCDIPCRDCGAKSVKVLEALICDHCKDEVDELYAQGGFHLCLDCILEDFDRIDEDNWEDYE